jgi:hypothetical protein
MTGALLRSASFFAVGNPTRGIANARDRLSRAAARKRACAVVGQTIAAKFAQQSHVVKQLFTGSAFLNRKAARDATRFTFRSN